MAVSQPKDWKLARSMTLRPPSSLNFTHTRSMSPQSALPTVPMASALGSSPMFSGFAIAAVTRAWKSSDIVRED